MALPPRRGPRRPLLVLLATIVVALPLVTVTTPASLPRAGADEPLVRGVSAGVQARVGSLGGSGDCADVGGTSTDSRTDWGTQVGTLTVDRSGGYNRPASPPDSGEASAAAQLTASVDSTNGFLTRFDSTQTATAVASSVRGWEPPTSVEDSFCSLEAAAGDGVLEVRFAVAVLSSAELDFTDARSGDTAPGSLRLERAADAGETSWVPVVLRDAPGSDVEQLDPGTYRVVVTYGRAAAFAGLGQGSGGSSSSTSTVALAVEPILAPLTDDPPTPEITGTRTVGSTLTADPRAGAWPPETSFSYTWFADGARLDAVGRTLRVTSTLAGRRVAVRVRGSKPGFLDVDSPTSPPVSILRQFRPARPRIIGQPRVGKVLTARTGSWDPAPTSFGYRWFVGKRAVRGATRRVLTVTRAMRGGRISVRVTGRRSGYEPASRTSAATRPVR